MGHEIVYCFKCLTRLTGSEFEKGKAFRFGLKVSCKACLPDLLATLTPDERKRFQEAPAPPREPEKGISSTRIRPATTRRRADEDPPAAPAKGKGLVWGLAAGAIVVGAAVVLLRGDPPAPGPASTPPPVADSPKTAPEDARLRKAREAIDRAKRTSAADLDAKLALWAEAVKAAQGTELHGEALEAEQILSAQRKTMYDREVSALQEEARPAIDRGEHAAAAGVFEKARARHPGPEWAAAMAAKVDGVKRAADAAYAALKARAVAAARKGDVAEARMAEEAVVRMGYADLTADLRRELAATKPDEKPKPPPPETPPSPELLAYRSLWLKAIGLAAARDFDGAVAEQARAAKDLKEKDAQAEAARDAEDLARLRDLVGELRRSARAAPGRDVSLEVFDDEGKRRKLQGKVVRSSPERAELAGDPTRFVEFSDLTAASLAEALAALRTPAAGEQRALGLLCWAEGDTAAGARLFGQAPAKVKDLAKDAAARLPRRSDREREARKLFYEAEREYREPSTRGEAVAKCRRLVAEFADAAIVKSDADLRRRAEEGREYYFGASSLRAGGTFKAQKGEKPETYWGSVEDTDPEKATENFVEFEFLAVADTPYKAWVYAGGCCGEVFGLTWQATDLSGPNPKKSSETIQAPPEGPNHLPVRHGVLYLKPKHADHLGPKSPKRWAWVPLPLPKYPTGGPKRVRVLTNQKGFSVAYAVVSATRSSPPGDADLKDLRTRSSGLDQGLLAWWRLDEAAGPTAADSVGTGEAQARGAVEWGVRGKLGGAVRLSGSNAWLEAPHQAALNAFPITVSAWIQTTSTAGGRGVVNKYASGTQNGYQIHLHQGSVRAWYFRERGSSIWDGADGLNGGAVNDGAWHHVAFVVDAEGGRLFVDGVRKDSRAWAGTAGPPTATHPVNLGRYPASGFHEGLIDDVRIYGRALSDPEVLALYGGGPEAPAPEARPWKPIFDGKTSSFLGGGSQNAWKVEDGALVRAPGPDDAAQSKEQFGDGEFRFRFEISGVETVRFSMRQGGEGTYSVPLDDRILATAKTHELVIVCNGDSVTAALNGKPVPVESNGRPARGHIQFNCRLGSMRLLSLEMRPLP